MTNILSDEELVLAIQGAERAESAAKQYTKSLKEEFKSRRIDSIDSLYKSKDEPFGTVHLEIAERDIEIIVRKEVDWDQLLLAAAHHKMLTDGLRQEEINEYLKISYEISENKYKAWPTNIRNYFEAARTVKPGNMSIKVKELKEK
jgi:hypothetical protein